MASVGFLFISIGVVSLDGLRPRTSWCAELDRDEVAQVLCADPRVASVQTGHTEELAQALRAVLWERVPLGQSDVDDWTDLPRIVGDAVNGDSHLCLGMAAIYQAALSAFEVPNRHVQLYDEVSPLQNGHNSVEVLVDGAWIGMDPTFNTEFHISGKPVGYTEVRRACRESPAQLSFHSPSPQINPQRKPTHSSYYTYCDLTAFLAIGPSRTGEESAFYPENWDGVLVQDGGPFDINRQLTEGVPWRLFQDAGAP